mmetsp:Transcript_4773/g.6231  ORF Transcript_4773/g.6231 Transcript_4773/m.6231 type:complete len:81 (+) Transcript_4773:120-362(+)
MMAQLTRKWGMSSLLVRTYGGSSNKEVGKFAKETPRRSKGEPHFFRSDEAAMGFMCSRWCKRSNLSIRTSISGETVLILI